MHFKKRDVIMASTRYGFTRDSAIKFVFKHGTWNVYKLKSILVDKCWSEHSKTFFSPEDRMHIHVKKITWESQPFDKSDYQPFEDSDVTTSMDKESIYITTRRFKPYCIQIQTP